MDIRLATLEDAQTLLEWRNDPLTRAMSHNQDLVQWDAHVRWLGLRLDRPEPRLYVATHDGHPIGTFRVDGDQISYTISPHARGNGHGYAMLCKAREMFGPMVAEIYEHNTASIKIAERSGMIVRILATPDILPKAACEIQRHRMRR